MKKLFKVIGLISLICFSFFVTEKTATVVNDMDEIMIQIKQNSDKYKVESVDAIVNNNTIVPGIYGKKVNIKKSYKNMKQKGYYTENLFVYDYIKPNISLDNNIDKYIIGGNTKKRMVSLIFIARKNSNIDRIIKIAQENDIKVNFFIDDSFLSNNNDLVLELIKNNNTIGLFTKDLEYENSSFGWMDTIIKKVGNQENGYCYNVVDDDNALNQCILLKNYIIRPNIITSSTHLIDIKNKLTSGSLIAMEINEPLEKQLSSIINYIKSKGYVISNLQEHLNEK